MEFTFVSAIYVLECGHSAAVRSNRPSEQGAIHSCSECTTEQTVVDVVTLG